MARIVNPNIPPSMLDQYVSLLHINSRWDQSSINAQISRNLFYPNRADTRPILLKQARVAVEWLSAKYTAGMSLSAKRSFEYDRLTEILSGDFNAAYWDTATNIATKAARATPFCVLDVNGVDPAYQDPNRQASWCTYDYTAKSYDVPTPHTGLPDPSPGWYGEVNSTIYEDSWLVQLMSTWSLATNMAPATDTPGFVVADVTWELSSSHRPNRIWASVTMSGERYQSSPTIYPSGDVVHAFHDNRFQHRLPLSAPATPWSETVEKRLIADIREIGVAYSESNTPYLLLVLCPAPAHGRYFARNDWVQCWLSASVVIYTAKL